MQFNDKNILLDPCATARVRVLLASEQPAAWHRLFAPLAARGIDVDTSDSAGAALAALQEAASASAPYRVVMLAPMIQGMSAELLGTAIRNDQAHRETALAILGEGEEQGGLPTGFHVWIVRSMAPEAVASAIEGLCKPAPRPQSPPAGPAMPLPFAGRRVLVADDNPVNRQVAAGMLEKLGCKVDVAVDGQQAIEMHGKEGYDLLLMDCDMPKLDGYQATLRIRAMEGTARRTPVIALTASTPEDESGKCFAAGMDDFLPKPVRPQILKDMLARLLQSAPASAAPVAIACDDELDAVRTMFGTDFSELATLYQTDSPPRLAALRAAHDAGDIARTVTFAHALAGSSASIGATGLSALCNQLEMRAKQGWLDDFDSRFAAIETEYRRVRDKLQNLLD